MIRRVGQVNEFELIRRFFGRYRPTRTGTRLGIGDDAALLHPPPDQCIVATIDTMVAGSHFLDSDDPAALGHKVLAVNLSDLAAMGAEPAWFLLSLTLPESDEQWLGAFAESLAALAGRFGIDLVGGDTTRGPRSLTVQAVGTVPEGEALRRNGAHAGDRICVTGCLGDAALALDFKLGHRSGSLSDALSQRLERPEPRVAAGLALRGRASACIDISDGLAADLRHVLTASGVGASVRLPALPCSAALQSTVGEETAWQYALAGGDDYELCFTLPPDEDPEEIAVRAECPVTVIGEITAGGGLELIDAAGAAGPCRVGGWQHFE